MKFIYLGSFSFCTAVFRMLLWWISSEKSCLLILEVAFETYLFLFVFFFFFFWKVKSLVVVNLFISEYLDEMMLAFLLKLQTEYLCFCFFKLNKTHATQTRNIMKYSSTFIRISESIPEVKKSALINDYENILLIQKSPSNLRCRQTNVFCSKYMWGSWRVWGSVPPQENLTAFTHI